MGFRSSIAQRVRKALGSIVAESSLDFEDSGTVTWTVTDDPSNSVVSISAAAAGGSGTPASTVAKDVVDVAGTVGTSTNYAREDHGHEVDTTAGPGADVTIDAAGAAGATGQAARTGHGHRVNTSANNPVALGAASAGTSGNSPSRDNHVHPTTGLVTTSTGAGGDLAGIYPNPTVAQASQAFALTGVITDTSTGTVNNWAPTGLSTATTIRWNGASGITLNNLTGAATGRIIILQNITAAQTITIKHDTTGSGTATNNFYCPNSVDATVRPNEYVVLDYDNTSTRWRVSGEPIDTAAGANDTIDAAGSTGTAGYAASSGHGHQVVTTDAPSGANITIDAAASAAATGAIARAAHGHQVATSATTALDTTPGVLGVAGSTGAIARVGHDHRSPGGMTSITSEVSITSTAAETNIISFTLPTSYMAAGTTFRFIFSGTIQCQATSGTLTFKPYVGANVSSETYQMANQASAAGPGGIRGEIDCTVRTTGASGTYISSGWVFINFSTATALINLWSTTTTTATVDTTAATPVIKLTATWATSSATNSLKVETATIDVIKL